ncbi:hypothetical protein GCM10027347_17630 [Larkinella harenae]
MTETEHKAQLKKAKANLELKQMYHRAGKVSKADVAEAQLIYDQLKAYRVPVEPLPVERSNSLAAESAVVLPAMPVSEFTRLLEELTIENAEAHKQMAMRANRLADYPDTVNVKGLVDEIQEWKAKRNALGEKIAYLKANGRLPDLAPVPDAEDAPEAVKSTFLANLPAERYELSRLITNSLSPKVSRARKGLARAKTDLWRAHYTKQLAQAEAELALAKSKMAALA